MSTKIYLDRYQRRAILRHPKLKMSTTLLQFQNRGSSGKAVDSQCAANPYKGELEYSNQIFGSLEYDEDHVSPLFWTVKRRRRT